MRAIHEIADDIRATWPTMSVYAKPYVEAMRSLNGINDSYYADSAHTVVIYFLSNASSWRGEDARRIKAELKAMIR